MCERNSALRIVTMSNLQMRRSIASISKRLSNRMHSQDPESSERLLSVASVTRPHPHCLCPSTNSPEHQAWYDAQPPYPRPTPSRQAARAATYTASSPTTCSTPTALESPAAPLSNIDKVTCDVGSPAHPHRPQRRRSYHASNAVSAGTCLPCSWSSDISSYLKQEKVFVCSNIFGP